MSVINVLGVPWEGVMRTVVTKITLFSLDVTSSVFRFSCVVDLEARQVFTAQVRPQL